MIVHGVVGVKKGIDKYLLISDQFKKRDIQRGCEKNWAVIPDPNVNFQLIYEDYRLGYNRWF